MRMPPSRLTGSCAATKTIPTRRRRSNPPSRSCSDRVDLKIQPVTLPVDAYFPDGRPLRSRRSAGAGQSGDRESGSRFEKGARKELDRAADRRRGETCGGSEGGHPGARGAHPADQAAMATPVPGNMEQLAEEARKLEHAANVVAAEADLILAHYDFDQARSDPAKIDEKKLAARHRQAGSRAEGTQGTGRGLHVHGPQVPDHEFRTPLGAGALDRVERQSADRARGHQSYVAAPFRQAAGAHGVQLRPEWQAAHASGTAGLAGGRVHGSQLGHEGHSSADGHLQHVSHAVLGLHRGFSAAEDRRRQYVAVAHEQRRMEAEAVRDSVLSLAGKLDTTMYGPDIDPGEKRRDCTAAASISGRLPTCRRTC